MPECRNIYVQHHEDDDLMKISFLHHLSPSQTKELTFLRSKEEKLSSTLLRMKSKIEQANLPKSKKKKAKDSTQSSIETFPIDLKVICCGKELEDNVTNKTAWTLGTLFRVNDLCYDIVVNPPVVSHIRLPKVITTSFLVYPTVCLEAASKEDSVFTWYRYILRDDIDSLNQTFNVDQSDEHWLRVGESFFYSVSDQDLGHKLKVVCLPKLGTRKGLKKEAISTSAVVKGLDHYPFQERHNFTQTLTTSGNIRCVSYNILADLYADTDVARNELFSHCPAEYLDFDYRKQLCMKEVAGYNGDIVCLQEVDRKLFAHDLIPVLKEAGLEGLYSEKGGPVAEGGACFFRSTKFRLIHSEVVILTKLVNSEPYLGNIRDKLNSNQNLLERFDGRNTTMQVVVLEFLDIPNQRIVVGNTHLYFHPDADNIRLIQAYVCVKYLEQKLIKYNSESPIDETSLIFCGDFNSCPEFGVYRLLTGGCVSGECEDWKSNEEEAVDGILLRHSLSLSSGCGTPTYTNFTRGFSGCLDYIFYDSSKFVVAEVVPLPTDEQVNEHVALPNKVFPSDHIALVCTLQVIN